MLTTSLATKRRHQPLRGAVAGLLAAGVALGLGELVSGLVRGTVSPVVSVGSAVIDRTPSWLKTFAVRRFGTNDKPILIAGTLILLTLFAIAMGILANRKLVAGMVGIGLFGVIGLAAALTRPTATAKDVLPSLIGSVGGIAALVALLRRHPIEAVTTSAATKAHGSNALDRRGFLVRGGSVALGAAALGGAGRQLRRRFDVSKVRNDIALPKPASAAAPVPAGVDFKIPGQMSFITPNSEFYRIDTTLTTPQVDPQSWNLKVHGMVDKNLSISYKELLARPMIERDITMICVSNEIGGTYTGTARWLGVPLADILKEAGIKAGSDQLVSKSVDGWTAGSPVSTVTDGRDAMIAIGMNGEPLPVAHGFPARLVVPGLYGFVSATKWVTDLELTTFASYDPYWARRGWGKQAPIKTMSRIDTPRGLSKVPAGRVPLAGVAWAIHTGITKVEIKIDSGEWQETQLAEALNTDTWRQWMYAWDATPGTHNVTVRATDATGTTQTDKRANPIPDGAAGWHSIVVIVE